MGGSLNGGVGYRSVIILQYIKRYFCSLATSENLYSTVRSPVQYGTRVVYKKIATDRTLRVHGERNTQDTVRTVNDGATVQYTVQWQSDDWTPGPEQNKFWMRDMLHPPHLYYKAVRALPAL